MSKRCAKCEKTVYPTEELKCLDKVWHKACFRCWECNMALNMKNYKGYDKKPYCNAHYPTTRFTAVAETPEMSRIAQNTKMQSQIQYHEDFEKSKGKFTVVDDDPETLRIRQNTQIQSSVKYHEDFERNIKGSKIQVADDPETLRIKANTNVISGIEYKGLRERSNDMEARRSSMQQDEVIPKENPKRISNYDPTKVGGMRMAPVETANPSPYSNKNVGHSTVYNSQGKVEQSGNKRVGSIADYDPLNENFGSLQKGYAPSSTTSQTQQWEETIPEPSPQNHAPKQEIIKRQASKSEPEHHYPAPQHNMPSQDMGGPQRVMGGPQHGMGGPQHGMGGPQHVMGAPQHGMGAPQHGMGAPQHGMGGPQHGMGGPQHGMGGPQHGMGAPQQGKGGPQHGMPSMAPVSQPPAAQPTQPPPQPAAPQPPKTNSAGPMYQAMYDYEAQDEDEVGFIDGDLIIECQPIDEGWMFGTIRRTGQRGMLPANYVEQVQ